MNKRNSATFKYLCNIKQPLRLFLLEVVGGDARLISYFKNSFLHIFIIIFIIDNIIIVIIIVIVVILMVMYRKFLSIRIKSVTVHLLLIFDTTNNFVLFFLSVSHSTSAHLLVRCLTLCLSGDWLANYLYILEYELLRMMMIIMKMMIPTFIRSDVI